MANEKKNNTNDTQNETSSSHFYDGIEELNNPSPKWIILIFLVTIAFALIYAVHYFGYPGNKKDQVSEYERKTAAFEEKKAAMKQTNAANSVQMDESEILAAGASLYAEKGCIACHGMNGEGNNIGPNLTDEFWLNGCSEDEVIKIITEGKPEKGMTPYKSMMSEDQINHLSKYILSSLVGSNPANAKALQGEECE